MKRHPNTRLVAVLLIFIVYTGAASAVAQSYARGSFTLPYEVDWHGETVAAGQYTFEIQQAVPQPVVIVRDMEQPHKITLIGSAAAVSNGPLRSSALEIITVDGKHYIHAFDISAMGASLIYSTPKLPTERFSSAREVARITMIGAQPERQGIP